MITKGKTSKYYYAVLWENGKNVWYNTKSEDEVAAQLIHDQLKDKAKEKKKHEHLARLLGIEMAVAKAPVEPDKKGIPIAQIWTKYVKEKPNPSRHIKAHWSAFEDYLKTTCQEVTDILAVTKYHAHDFLEEECEELTGKTYNNIKASLSSIWLALSVCADIENVWKKIPNRPNEPIRHRSFTDDEVKAILNNSKGFWRDASYVAVHTGLRKKDIIFLQWKQIDFDKGFIQLIPAKVKRYNKAVCIPFGPNVKNLLEGLRNNSTYVWPEAASRYTSGAFGEEFPAILKTCGITDTENGSASFHSFRSTFVSRATRYGISTKAIQGIVGHSNPAMTKWYNDDFEKLKEVLSVPNVQP